MKCGLSTCILQNKVIIGILLIVAYIFMDTVCIVNAVNAFNKKGFLH